MLKTTAEVRLSTAVRLVGRDALPSHPEAAEKARTSILKTACLQVVELARREKNYVTRKTRHGDARRHVAQLNDFYDALLLSIQKL